MESATQNLAATVATVARTDLAAALRAAGSIKSKAVHLDFDSDGLVSVAGYTPATAMKVKFGEARDQSEAATVVVSRPQLASLLPYCGAEFDLSRTDTHLEIVSGADTFSLPTLVRDNGTWDHDFANGRAVASYEAPTLLEVLRRSLPFAGRDQTRPVLCVIALHPERNLAVTTDSYRLTVVRHGDDSAKKDDEQILLPVDAALSIRRLLSKQLGTVEIAATDKFLTVAFEDIVWSAKQIVGKYPEWSKLVPDDKASATLKVDREDLLNASRACAVIATRNAPLRMNLTKGAATISTIEREVGRVACKLTSAEVSGATVEMGLNPDFLADICAAAPIERITVSVISPLRPILVEAARDTYLLMPIRLNV